MGQNRIENPKSYLEKRGIDIPEEDVEYGGESECEECGWLCHTFWAGHNEFVRRQVDYCPRCSLQALFSDIIESFRRITEATYNFKEDVENLKKMFPEEWEPPDE